MNTLLSAGYNGSPSGISHCTEAGCIMLDNHCVNCNHAGRKCHLPSVQKRYSDRRIYCICDWQSLFTLLKEPAMLRHKRNYLYNKVRVTYVAKDIQR